MDLFANENLYLKILVEYFGENGNQVDLAPEIIGNLEEKYGHDIYARILFSLTQIEFLPEQAKEYWSKIIDHRSNLKKALGRDAGLRVALCDFFTNIEPKFKNPIFLEVGVLLQKEKAAFVDDMTGLFNRRFFNQALQKAVEMTKRSDIPFSLLIIDVNSFKEYNDLFGHKIGDRILSDIAETLKLNARAIDYLVRYGGDEFALILPETDKETSIQVAHRHKEAVDKRSFYGEGMLSKGNLSISLGLATYPVDAYDGLDLFRKADEALYQAKAKPDGICHSLPEQRQEIRRPFAAEALYNIETPNETLYYSGEIIDISLGGMLCHSQNKIDKGAPVEISFNDPTSGDNMILHARAVRVIQNPDVDQGYHLGMSFEFTTQQEKDMLRTLIESQSSGMQSK